MNAEINKEFIFKYLSGKTSALQKQMVDEWVRDPLNEEQFYNWLVEFEYQNPQYITNVPQAIENFRSEADQYDANPNEYADASEKPVFATKVLWKWLIAASIIMGVLLGGVKYQENIRYINFESAYGQTRTIWLEDSSKVVLNANSSLKVPRFGFGKSTRDVFLKGEASFSVTHLANNQRFVVKTSKEMEVVVLGTEFTVYARQQKARVVLKKGRVQLNYQSGSEHKKLTMKPGELITLDQNNQLKQETIAQPEKYTAWQNHRFEFDDTPLYEFAELMQENYGMKVIIKDEVLAGRTLVGSYRAENPDELLDIVSKLFNIKITREGDTIYLTN